jgi:hypothetical protein
MTHIPYQTFWISYPEDKDKDKDKGKGKGKDKEGYHRP